MEGNKKALQGRLWEIEHKACKKTGVEAWYLSCDPSKAPTNNQFNLFNKGSINGLNESTK